MAVDTLSSPILARPAVTPLRQQVGRVRRRLFLQRLLQLLVSAWLGAVAVALVWFLLQPYLLTHTELDPRWWVAGGLLALGTVVAVGMALARIPNPVEAALALDRQFHLRERVTTTVMLSPLEAESSVGKALLEDVNHRLAPLHVGDRFPVRVPWNAALLPVGGLLLVLLAVFFPPHFAPSATDNPKPGEGPLAQEIKEQVKQQLQPKKVTPKEQQARQKSQELENLEAQRDKLAQSKMDTREEAMDVVKNMSALEEQMQKRDKQLAQRADALKQQMKQLQRMSKNRVPGDGPASKMNRAVEQGDFQRADKEAKDLAKQLAEQQQIEDAIDKIEKKLKEGNLTPQEKEKLEKELNKLQKKKMTQEQKDKLRDQLKDLQEKIEKLARDPKERAKELQEMAEKGLIDEEQLQRELDQLKEQLDQLDPKMVKGLEEVANKLRKSLEAMEKGDEAEAGRLLEEAVDKLAQLDPTAERDQLKQQLQQLLEARRMIAEGLENNQGGQGAGRRPDGKPHDTKSEEQRARSAFEKGALQVVDVVPGQGFKGPRSPAELGEEIRQATQAAPEAIDRQRLPQSASDMARGYFEKLRGPEKK